MAVGDEGGSAILRAQAELLYRCPQPLEIRRRPSVNEGEGWAAARLFDDDPIRGGTLNEPDPLNHLIHIRILAVTIGQTFRNLVEAFASPQCACMLA